MDLRPKEDWEIAQQGAVVTADLEFFPDKPHYPKRRPKRLRQRHRALTVHQILAWADAHFERTGQWPSNNSGEVCDAPGETWLNLSAALREGRRGLPTGSGFTLARLLTQYRGVRNRREPPPLTLDQILRWADAHFAGTGTWPHADSGSVLEAPGETWAPSIVRCGTVAAACRGVHV